jgi:hypothetical protein
MGEHCQLLDVFLSNEIEVELLGIEPSIEVYGSVFNFDALVFAVPAVELSLVKRPNSYDNFDIISLVVVEEMLRIFDLLLRLDTI